MRLRRATPGSAATIDDRIMPLINIVFLLLIFFLVAGVIRSPAPFELTPPTSISEATDAEAPLTIYLAQDGRLALDDEVAADEAGLVDALLATMTSPEEADLRLLADRDVDAVSVISLMERLRTAGFERVRLVTEQGVEA